MVPAAARAALSLLIIIVSLNSVAFRPCGRQHWRGHLNIFVAHYSRRNPIPAGLAFGLVALHWQRTDIKVLAALRLRLQVSLLLRSLVAPLPIVGLGPDGSLLLQSSNNTYVAS